jgi:hypothetical protein
VSLVHVVTLCTARLRADRVARRIAPPLGALRFFETLTGDSDAESGPDSDSDDALCGTKW